MSNASDSQVSTFFETFKNNPLLVVVLSVFFIVFIFVAVIISPKVGSPTQEDIINVDGSIEVPNQVILENEDSSTSEGASLPDGLDLSLLPDLPEFAVLRESIDNKQDSLRHVILKYVFPVKDMGSLKDEVSKNMTKKGWVFKSVNQNNVIEAEKGPELENSQAKYQIKLLFEQVDKEEIIMNISLIVHK